MNIFTEKYGTPARWTCPDCGVLFILYPALPFDKDNHNCAKKRGRIPIAKAWYRLIDDHRVESLVFDGLAFPDDLTVETLSPTGETEFWTRRPENGRDVFYPPKHYTNGEFFNGERGAIVRPGPRQLFMLIPRPMQEKEALHNRVSARIMDRQEFQTRLAVMTGG
mgnify:CR=1 FL=1